MNPARPCLLAFVLAVVLAASAARAGESPAASATAEAAPKPLESKGPKGAALLAKLKALPPNAWVDLGLPWHGGHEVPAVYDKAHGLFFKYGGCGDRTPPEKISFPKGDPRYPNGYSNTCWAVDLAQGEWRMIRNYDCSWPADRPANGCSRNYAYDSKRKVIWMYGGVSDGGGGFDVWDMASYNPEKDAFTRANAKNAPHGGDGNGGDVFAYDSKRDCLVMPKVNVHSGKHELWMYWPTRNEWEKRDLPTGPGSLGHYGTLVYDAGADRFVCSLPGGSPKTSAEKQPNDERWLWHLDKQAKIWRALAQETWVLDPAKSLWTKACSTADEPAKPSPCPRYRCGLAYDARNKVVVLIGGSDNTWENDERYFNDVWIFETAKGAWTRMDPPKPWPKGNSAWRDNRSCAYVESENVVLWMPNAGSVWGYRYK